MKAANVVSPEPESTELPSLNYLDLQSDITKKKKPLLLANLIRKSS